jgi:hypothetical protein
MAYTAFDSSKPNFSDSRTSQVNYIRTNLTALRDAVIMAAMKGFNYSWSGGTADKPTYQYYKNGNTWLRATITWGADDNPTSILYEKSTNGGLSYAAIGTVTYSYDADGNLDSSTWS